MTIERQRTCDVSEPLVSIVIVNYNDKEHLKSCLHSVLNCDYPNLEIILIDNGSIDGSLDFLKKVSKSNSNVKVILNKENLGPSRARNQGIKEAKGEYVAFLDNDTKVHRLWLKEAIKNFKSDPTVGACQCKLILDETENVIDCVGEYLGQYGFLVQVVVSGEEKDVGQYDHINEILAAKSAGMIARKSLLLNNIGGFDNDFFMFMEDTDLCWRIWLQNSKVILIPESVVYHKSGASSVILPEESKYLVKFHGTKNYVATLLKNFELKNLLKILPLHLCGWMSIALFFLFHKKLKSAKWISQGILWNFIHFRSILEKRRIVQKQRLITDDELFSKIVKKQSLGYFLEKLKSKKQVGYAVGWDRGF